MSNTCSLVPESLPPSEGTEGQTSNLPSATVPTAQSTSTEDEHPHGIEHLNKIMAETNSSPRGLTTQEAEVRFNIKN